jgi:signal transduction histidine kinase/ActR/RegA family two-component response regulator
VSDRSRWLGLVAGLIVALAVGALYLRPPSVLQRADLAAYDFLLGRTRDGLTSGRIVIVDVDEASLGELGRWPWPRHRLAKLFWALREQGATAVGVGMFFPEPEEPEGERALADVLRDPAVVVGYAFTFGDAERRDGVPPKACAVRPVPSVVRRDLRDSGQSGLFRASGVVCSVPVLAEASAASGFVNAAPDDDGIFRRVPQLIEYRSRVHPGLGLAVLMRLLDVSRITLDGSRDRQTLRLGDAALPLDAWGNMLLNFRGGARAFPYVSARDVLSGRLAPGSLRDKVVFLDASAVGIRKVVATPVDPLLPAAEVHATIVDNVLRGDVLSRPRWATTAEMALVLALGVAVAGLLAWTSPAAAALVAALTGGLLWAAAAWLFHGRATVVSPLFPSLALAGSLAVSALLNVALERRRSAESGRAAAESERAAAESRRAAAELSSQVEERRRREEAAREANRAKSEFLARMSHELRTPLNAILGFGQLLELDATTPEQRESADQIVRAGRHLLSLIDEVLDISRIEAGRIRLAPESIPAAESVQRCLGLVAPLAQNRGIELRADQMDERWLVVADPKRLDQVLLNVLSNAVKYNRDGGRVSVAMTAGSAGRLRVSITDTGQGIAPDKLPRLFTPFERLGAERTDVEGTGLGLALSKQLVEAMGGSMQAESTLGQGTTFTIDLTLAAATVPALHAVEAQPVEAVSPSALSLTVLCIEDDASNLRLVESILARRAGTVLVSAHEGRTGLQLARERQPDLVLLDRHLPDMPGEDVLRQLVEDPRTKHIAVALLTANASPSDADRLLAAGGHAYLTKPVDVPHLFALLEEIAARKDVEMI